MTDYETIRMHKTLCLVTSIGDDARYITCPSERAASLLQMVHGLEREVLADMGRSPGPSESGRAALGYWWPLFGESELDHDILLAVFLQRLEARDAIFPPQVRLTLDLMASGTPGIRDEVMS